MIRAAGGRFLVRGIPAEVFEAKQKLLTVVIEFESVPATTATYNNPAYQDCVKLLRDAVVRDKRESMEAVRSSNSGPMNPNS